MRVSHLLTLASLIVATLCGAARAQPANFTGAWSIQTNTPQGPSGSTVFLRPDGQFVRADRLATGTMLRQWGQYQAQQIGPNAFRIDTRVEGYLPHTSCVSIPGFGQRCNPAPPPPNQSTAFTLTSPSTLMADGMVWQRDGSGGLLNVQVPDVAVVAGNAPMQPSIQQPTMPQYQPYTTPNGPGNQAAGAFHEQNRTWLDTNMRGCTIDQNGQRWGCQQ